MHGLPSGVREAISNTLKHYRGTGDHGMGQTYINELVEQTIWKRFLSQYRLTHLHMQNNIVTVSQLDVYYMASYLYIY